MEFIKRKVASFMGPAAASAPISDTGLDPQTIVKIPQSGLERAEWFARNDLGLGKQTLGLCSGGMAAISTNQRGVQGVERDDAFGSLILSRHNYAQFPEPASLTSAAAGQIWNTQVAASNGLYDGDKEVYVGQDTQTIWT
jgi:hypothetical protein